MDAAFSSVRGRLSLVGKNLVKGFGPGAGQNPGGTVDNNINQAPEGA